MISCVLILPLLVVLAAIIIMYVYHLKVEKERKKYKIELEKKERQIKKYLEDIDYLQQFFKGIHEFSIMSKAHLDEQELFNLIVEKTTRMMKTEIGSLMLLNPETNLIEIVAAVGLSDEIVKSTKLRIGEGIAGRVFLEGEPIFCSDIEKDPRFMRKPNIKYYSKSFISVPLKVLDKVIGVLNVNNKEEMKEFNKMDLDLLSLIADEAARVIENFRLYQRMRSMYIGSIKALAQALDARDAYYKGHSDRVTRYAVSIARKMNLPQGIIENIRYAAMIHDIGKIGIPDTILQKIEPLTKDEWERIREHPDIGEALISPIDFLENVTSLIKYHHERWDGKGYPEGLKGDEIPLGARIISIADSFDSMTSTRPYRKALTKKEAMDELIRQRGKQFDPKIVDIFLDVLKEENNI